MKSTIIRTSSGRTYEVNYTDADFIDWVKRTKLPENDIYILFIEYLSERYQELFYLDGEIIEDIDFDISQELEKELEIIKEARKYNL